jgi:hypothetical protein
MLKKEIATTQAHENDKLNQLTKALLKKLDEISEREEIPQEVQHEEAV